MSTKGYRITAATGIHKGDRDYQQDQVALLSHHTARGCLLAVLADGMGGRSGGRKASDQVMLTAKQLFERYSPTLDDPVATLRQLVLEAHTVIRLTAISSEEEPHSTIAVFLVNPGGIATGHMQVTLGFITITTRNWCNVRLTTLMFRRWSIGVNSPKNKPNLTPNQIF